MTENNKLSRESIVKAMHQNNGLDASEIEAYTVQGILFLKGAGPLNAIIIAFGFCLCY